MLRVKYCNSLFLIDKITAGMFVAAKVAENRRLEDTQEINGVTVSRGWPWVVQARITRG